MSERTEWQWIERYAEQFRACALGPDETVVVLSETRSRAVIVETARLAVQSLGASVVDVVLATPPNPGPLPIRSTGASVAIAHNPAALAALQAADFVVDCTLEGMLHAPEKFDILGAGTRILMISNEHPENSERWPHLPALTEKINHGKELLSAAKVMSVTSEAGTDLRIELAGAVIGGSIGYCPEPGTIAHWPGGLVLCFPAAGTVNGKLVLAPGDVNLSFKEYIRSSIELDIADDTITSIKGEGHDAEFFRSYLDSFGEPEAFAVSHAGWGMNPAAHWESMAMWDKSQHNGTELRAFAGNFLYSTGANEVAGRYCRGHVDIPMRGCTVALDGDVVVDRGRLRADLTL